ncbi:tubulin domain-containing protein [Myxozyma melibiosi]|uniref:Protein DML1 n=1 Tax=Myxozyma melibiosi TaxID=54550 RepID=A0ABR1FFR7_9ASCO
MRELLHLSFSAAANHVTTHFFNTQEAYFTYEEDTSTNYTIAHENNEKKSKAPGRTKIDSYISFRPGLASDGVTETFTPRSLLWDLKGGHGSLKKYNALYDSVPDIPTKVTKIEQPRIEESNYIKALNMTGSTLSPDLPRLSASTARYWADYCNVFHHPRSLLEVGSYVYDPVRAPKGLVRGVPLSEDPARRANSEFRGWQTGVDEFKREASDAGEEALDTQFRNMLEECDMLGGVNVVVDVDSAWGGFASEALELIRDDYIAKSTIAVWGMEDRGDLQRDEQASRIETVLALSAAATAYIPLALPDRCGLLSDVGSLWEAGALFNLAFETLTLPARVRAGDPARADMLEIIEAATFGIEGERQFVSDVRVAAGDESVALGGQNSVNDGWMDARTRRQRAYRREKKSSAASSFGSTGVVRGYASASALTDAWARFPADEKWKLMREARLAWPLLTSAPAMSIAAGDVVSAGARSTTRTAATLAQMAEFVEQCWRSTSSGRHGSSDRGEVLEELDEARQPYVDEFEDESEEEEEE